MRNLGGRLAAATVLLLALAGTAAAQASPPVRLDNGPMPVLDAFKLKAAMGEAAFASEVDAVEARLTERTERTTECAKPVETAALAQLVLVRRSADPQAFERSRAAAEAALAKREELRPLYLSGAPAPRPYGLVSRIAARAKAAADPRLAELYRRMAEDQFSHIDSVTLKPFFGPGVHTTWETGLDEAALAYVNAVVSSEWCPMKISDAAWLKADLRQHGWYRISLYGEDADRSAWLIVQHARHDLALQEEALAMLEPLWQVGETHGENYALLYDQTAHYKGRPGRFGVMGDCTAKGVWTPPPLEDPEATDAWRAKAKMPPLAEYVATRSRACTD